jgi:soluble lytic murein transglycosylase-like protein
MKFRRRARSARPLRRHRRVPSILLAGATAFFAPHTGKAVLKSGHVTTRQSTHSSASVDPPKPLVGLVDVATAFHLAPSAFDHLIEEAAKKYDLHPALIRAVIAIESAFDPQAVSEAGALGLMQLMPALAVELGVSDPFDPRENIMAGTRYLSELLAQHDGNVELALASYNAGPGTVAHYQGVPPYPETKTYIKLITRRYARALAAPAD